MYEVPIPQRIKQIIAIFYRCGMWRSDDETVSRRTFWKLIYLIYQVSFVISLALGGFLSDDHNESIFLFSVAVTIAIITVRLVYILWKKEEILAFLYDIGVHSVTDHNTFIQINEKVNKLMKFGSCFILLVFMNALAEIVLFPQLSEEKILPENVASPLDWKNSDICYCIVYAYVAIGYFISIIALLLNTVIWYLMMNCSTKYEILGNQFKSIGSISATKATDKTMGITEVEKQKLFLKELIDLIKVHQKIRKTIDRFKSCFSNLFFLQITTSGLGICGAVYVLAFSSNEDLIETAMYVVFLAYNIFDVFMVMHFGNEIKISSDRLLYCLFECNWIGQSKSSKKYFIILSERLKQPHQLLIGKLYQMDLETFKEILRLAYSSFSILRNFNL